MANKILKIKRTYIPHRLEGINPWEYKGRWIMEPRAKLQIPTKKVKKKNNKKRTV